MAAQPQERLVAEVEALPPSQVLTESGPLVALQADARQIPYLLLEIGRLRELTFRQVGEGTGLQLDLDRFDAHYTHLFLWNREKLEVVGAYRLGRTDEIRSRYGVAGLYSHTLFAYSEELLNRLGPALELGRSFVRPEYQRHFAPLLLLWKGIGAFVHRHPHYRMLFGPVSISRDYSRLSRRLIADALQERCEIPELARLVQARNPLRRRRLGVKGCDPKLARALCRDFEKWPKWSPISIRPWRHSRPAAPLPGPRRAGPRLQRRPAVQRRPRRPHRRRPRPDRAQGPGALPRPGRRCRFPPPSHRLHTWRLRRLRLSAFRVPLMSWPTPRGWSRPFFTVGGKTESRPLPAFFRCRNGVSSEENIHDDIICPESNLGKKEGFP
jgi:hypothetical protein